jgi:hypothetical protein
MHKVQVDQEQIEERLARLEEALEHKADRDELEDCSIKIEELREDVGDLARSAGGCGVPYRRSRERGLDIA